MLSFTIFAQATSFAVLLHLLWATCCLDATSLSKTRCVEYVILTLVEDEHRGLSSISMQSGGLADLILLLSPAFPEEVGSSAAWAIHHGVHLNPQSQTMLGEAGGLNLLLQQIPAVSDSLQTNALLALNSAVLDNDANLKWCAENDVKEMLEIFLEEEGEDMSANAKQALQELVQELS